MNEADDPIGDEIGQAPDEADAATGRTDPASSPRRAVGRPRQPPPRVEIELVLVDGPEGRQLRQLQADAIRAVMQWFTDNHPTHPAP